MRKPGPPTYLFGNPLVVLAAIGATAFFGYQWWGNDGSPLPAVIAFLVACQSMRSSDQLQKYNDWKREWEAMEGKGQSARRMGLVWTPAIRFAIGVPAWCIGAYGMFTVPLGDDPPAKLALASFWLGSAIMAAVLIYRAFRLRRKPRTKNTSGPSDPCVSVCLLPPQSSPPLVDAYSQLPTYCHTIQK